MIRLHYSLQNWSDRFCTMHFLSNNTKNIRETVDCIFLQPSTGTISYHFDTLTVAQPLLTRFVKQNCDTLTILVCWGCCAGRIILAGEAVFAVVAIKFCGKICRVVAPPAAWPPIITACWLGARVCICTTCNQANKKRFRLSLWKIQEGKKN